MARYESYSLCPKIFNDEFPSHWKIIPMYGLAKEKKVSDCTDLELLSVYLDLGVIPFSQKAEKRTNVTSTDLSKYQRVDPGDFVLNNQQAWRGSVGVSRYTGIISPAYIVLEMDDHNNRDFMNYMLRSHTMVDQYVINSKSVGSIQRNIHWINLKRTYVPVPPRAEQDQIVRFLDWKVSEINKLIGIRRKEIQGLEELKARAIDKAVIHGLHGSSETHNDDIRWDIDYPSTWEIERLRNLFTFRKGLSITKANLEPTGIPVISYGQVHSKKNSMVGLNDELFKFVNPSYLQTDPLALVQKGDFIFADTSEDLEGSGNCAYIDRDGKIFAGYHSVIAHPKGSTNNKYFAYLFKSPTWRYQIRKKVNAVKVYSITQQILKDVFLLVPSQKEQQEIVRYLDSVCVKIDSLIESTHKKIMELAEMKSVIISDVVTGKIDVRNVTVPKYEYVDDIADDDSDGDEESDETETEMDEEV
jgi:type I restriction enzyme S subunit